MIKTTDAGEMGKVPSRNTWVAPAIEELPQLSQLTLQTGPGIPGTGGTGGGGSTVF